jgi:ABC-type amino acid transport substrate-binding protein
MVTSGRVDMECGSTTNTLARRRLVDFSLLTFVDGATLLYRPDKGLDEHSNFAGRRIAVVPGSTSEKAIQAGFVKVEPKPVVVPVRDHDECRDKLAKGEVDAYCSDRTLLIGLALQMPNPREVALLEQFLSYEPYGLVMRRGDPDFRLEVDRALARLYRTGAIGEIYRYWFGANPPTGLLRAMYMLGSIPE